MLKIKYFIGGMRIMTIIKSLLNDKMIQQKRIRKKNNALSMMVGLGVGVLAGIAINSNSDEISNFFKDIKEKNSKYLKIGMNKAENFVHESSIQMNDLKENLKDKINDKKEDIEDSVDQKLDSKVDELKNKVEDFSDNRI